MQKNPNIVTISVFPGAGGEDAKDWARMLVRMYVRYAEKKKWKTRYLDGLVLEVRGENVYDALGGESGVHRLVRISPYDAKKLRHTSFALVEVLPDIREEEVVLPDKDLKIDFFRSSGPGGQNVNKVETGVRITHLPTGITAVSQAERSQAGNRERAMRFLKAKLARVMEEKRAESIDALRVKVSPEWGREIRSYVLHPYKQVKDHRTGKKISRVEDILDGNLDLLEKIR